MDVQQIRQHLDCILGAISNVKEIPVPLTRMIDGIRPDLEPLQGSMTGFRRGVSSPSGGGGGGGGGGNGNRSFHSSSSSSSSSSSFSQQKQSSGGGGGGWRSMASSGGGGNTASPFGNSHSSKSNGQQNSNTPFYTNSGNGGGGGGSSGSLPNTSTRYQSRFKSSSTNLQDKILNTIIGNKLNTFSPITYNDVRDFIYQILDSGEIEFINDFVKKVFMKATREDIYCALFAKFLAEISDKYPLIRPVMMNYHKEFLTIFDDIQEGKDADYDNLVRDRQYRLGYGQFMSELAGFNLLDPECMYAMTKKIAERIETYTALEDKDKAVEEFIDCYVRMLKALKQKNNAFFQTIQTTMRSFTLPSILPIIEKKGGSRPSLSSKARYGLMDLRDILLNPV